MPQQNAGRNGNARHRAKNIGKREREREGNGTKGVREKGV